MQTKTQHDSRILGPKERDVARILCAAHIAIRYGTLVPPWPVTVRPAPRSFEADLKLVGLRRGRDAAR